MIVSHFLTETVTSSSAKTPLTMTMTMNRRKRKNGSLKKGLYNAGKEKTTVRKPRGTKEHHCSFKLVSYRMPHAHQNIKFKQQCLSCMCWGTNSPSAATGDRCLSDALVPGEERNRLLASRKQLGAPACLKITSP